LESKAEKDAEAYATFWGNFGAVVKEGLYDGSGDRDALLGLVRFRSTHGDGLVSLKDYVGRMKEGQKAIYYITGDDLEVVKRSPQLEGFRARGVEVLLMTDPVDQFWVPMVGRFDDKPFKSATQGGADLSGIRKDDGKDEAEKAEDKPVKEVRASDRLTESAVCLVAGEGDLDMNLERLMKLHGQVSERAPRILEVNPTHPLIRRLAEQAKADSGGMEDAAFLLLDQARILEGEALPDPVAFARRMSDVMAKGLGG
jgi:molecular chaperone HtpG